MARTKVPRRIPTPQGVEVQEQDKRYIPYCNHQGCQWRGGPRNTMGAAKDQIKVHRDRSPNCKEPIK
jgi:hypothetical protein